MCIKCIYNEKGITIYCLKFCVMRYSYFLCILAVCTVMRISCYVYVLVCTRYVNDMYICYVQVCIKYYVYVTSFVYNVM